MASNGPVQSLFPFHNKIIPEGDAVSPANKVIPERDAGARGTRRYTVRTLSALLFVAAGIVAGVVGTIIWLERKLKKDESKKKEARAAG